MDEALFLEDIVHIYSSGIMCNLLGEGEEALFAILFVRFPWVNLFLCSNTNCLPGKACKYAREFDVDSGW